MFARGATKYFSRGFSQRRLASTKTIREALEEVVPRKQLQLKQLKTEHSQAVLGEVTVENVVGGMRGLKAMLWEASVLDPIEGIRFHGLAIPDCQKQLPAAPGGKEIIAESMFWLLLTGKVPTEAETRQLSRELAEKGDLPEYIEKLIDSLLARLPALAARIYRNVYNPGKPIPAINKDLDLVGNYVNMLGFGDNHDLTEYMRLYIAIHGDHEGGNASAHTTHLVGSTLADPFISYSAALYALAGPLHGLANQEVLRWQMNMQKEIGDEITHDKIKEFLWKTLKSGQVVPGYGHGVLRNPDPRFMALQQFCESRPQLLDDRVIQLVRKTYEVAPAVLKEHGKTKNPYPNVDATSGCVLYHYGLTQFKYYTVIFGVSRALGCLTQLVWARALGLPIERPKSLSMDAIEKLIKN
ncbi:2-methylcitrate synthase, mitochondrial [Grifola frondosa]|uniref:Citrate synthase n=1 Tax=Grifola frondosa TaxID=5627 RepID=A0A1C7MDY0_GRIFR|nr:2-methylcitrate synthase, mitochondrial [Grifola frondosa]